MPTLCQALGWNLPSGNEHIDDKSTTPLTYCEKCQEDPGRGVERYPKASSQRVERQKLQGVVRMLWRPEGSSASLSSIKYEAKSSTESGQGVGGRREM